MKRLIAVSMLIFYLLNIGGQLAVHEYLVYQSDKLFNEQISENHYNIDDLTEVKIPVNMPNVTDWKNYENISGQVQFAGSSYNYVKMKVTRNAIYLQCVPNYKTTHLSCRNIIYAKLIKGVSIPKKDHVPFGKINILVYNNEAMQYKFSTPVITVRKIIYSSNSIIPNFFITGPGQPPKMETIPFLEAV